LRRYLRKTVEKALVDAIFSREISYDQLVRADVGDDISKVKLTITPLDVVTPASVVTPLPTLAEVVEVGGPADDTAQI
jgi:hypothetical protein